MPTTASSLGGPIGVCGSIVDSPFSTNIFSTRAFTWRSRLDSRSLPCFLYMCLSSTNQCFQDILFPSPLVRPVCSGFPKATVSSSLSLEGLNAPFSLSSASFSIFDTTSPVSSLANLRLLPDESTLLVYIHCLRRGFNFGTSVFPAASASASIFLKTSCLPA